MKFSDAKKTCGGEAQEIQNEWVCVLLANKLNIVKNELLPKKHQNISLWNAI